MRSPNEESWNEKFRQNNLKLEKAFQYTEYLKEIEHLPEIEQMKLIEGRFGIKFSEPDTDIPFLSEAKQKEIYKWWQANHHLEYPDRLQAGVKHFGLTDSMYFECIVDLVELHSKNEPIPNPFSFRINEHKDAVEYFKGFGIIADQKDWKSCIDIMSTKYYANPYDLEYVLRQNGIISPDEQDKYVACEILKMEGYFKGEYPNIRPILDSHGKVHVLTKANL